jgi:heme-degrading monooxygenase HmoA
MIARIWCGRTATPRAEEYVPFFEEQVGPMLSRIDGHFAACLLRRDEDERTEFVALTLWSSMDAIRKFAGDTLDAAVVEPAARAMLDDCDEKVRHYEVVSWPADLRVNGG